MTSQGLLPGQRAWPFLIVEGDRAAATRTAVEYAAGFVGEEHRAVDLIVAAPEGDKWTVSEIVEQVVAPASLTTWGDRRAIVIVDAHRAEQVVYDRLLLAVEEPTSATTFIAACPSAADLPATLRGRSADTLHAPEPDIGALAAMLAGVDPGRAERAARMVGTHIGWFERSEDCGAHLATIAGDLVVPRPAQRAHEIAAAVRALAAVSPVDGTDVAAAGRAPWVRSGTSAVLRQLLADIAAAARAGTMKAGDARTTTETVRRCMTGVERFAKPDDMLSVALCDAGSRLCA